jgi:hypothetical protein
MHAYTHILQPTYGNVCFILTELVIKVGYLQLDAVTVMTVYDIMQTICFYVFFEAIIRRDHGCIKS